jgi:Putative auto-transporter adhesin, head GIN domain
MFGKRKLIIILCITFLFESCSNAFLPDFLKRDNETITEERLLENFDRIHLNGLYEVVFCQDLTSKVVLSGTENQLNAIDCFITNDTLSINDDTNEKLIQETGKKALIEIHTPYYRSIQVNKPCNISSVDSLESEFLEVHFKSDISECSLNLNCNAFRFWNSYTSTGKFEFKGKSKSAYFGLNHMAHLFADELETNKTTIIQSSLGEAHVFAKNILDVTIQNKGNVYYYYDTGEILFDKNEECGDLIKKF